MPTGATLRSTSPGTSRTRSLAVRRLRHDTARRKGDIIPSRSRLLRANVPENCLHVVVETGCMRVTHRPNFCDYRVRSGCSHRRSPVVRSVCKSRVVRSRPPGMSARFASALAIWAASSAAWYGNAPRSSKVRVSSSASGVASRSTAAPRAFSRDRAASGSPDLASATTSADATRSKRSGAVLHHSRVTC